MILLPSLGRAVADLAHAGTTEPDADLLRRFVAGDDGAFGQIVRRHAAMVHGVCRRVLRGDHDAEDACQAAFLVLARKASSIDGRALAGFLHGVAYRVSLRLWTGGERRRRYEARASRPVTLDPAREVSLCEAAAILDEEIAGLPEKYRSVVASCCLEGLTRDEAARRLGWSAGVVKSRLEEARELLRSKLSRRGIDAPAVFALSTLRSAAPTVAEASSRAVALADEALRAMAAPGLRAGVVGLLAASLLALGAVAAWPSAEKHEAAAPPPPRVDAHGNPLPPGAVARLGTVRFRHGHHIYSVAFSPDGRTIASGAADNTIRLWDRDTGKEVRRITGHKDCVRLVTFTPDGRHLISASGTTNGTASDASIRLWEVATGKEVRRYLEDEHQKGSTPLHGFALSPDGKLLAAGRNRYLYLVEVATGKTVGVCVAPNPRGLRSTGFALRASQFAHDGTKVAALFDFYGLCLFDVASQKPLWCKTGQNTSALVGKKEMEFSPDGKSIAFAADVRGVMWLIDAATGEELRRFQLKGKEPVSPLQFTADGKRIRSWSWGRSSVLWDVASGRPIDPSDPFPYSSDLAPSPDGKTVAIAARQSVMLREAATGKRLVAIGDQDDAVRGLSLSPDGRSVVAAGGADGPLVWNLATARVRAAVAGQEYGSATAAFSPDGKAVFAGGSWGKPVAADAATGKVLRVFDGDPDWIGSLIASPDGNLLFGLPWNEQAIKLWDARTGKKLGDLPRFSNGGRAACLAVSPGGKLVAAGGMDGVVRLLDVAARKEVRQLVGQKARVWGVAFSPDGRRLAAVTACEPKAFGESDSDRIIRIWDVAAGDEVRAIQGPPKGSWCVAWSRDGRLLATGGEDDLARVWEVASGQERLSLRGHQGAVISLAFTPGGRLVTGSYDTTALVWDLAATRRPVAAPADERFPKLWDGLAGDAEPAFRAILALEAGGDTAVRWLATRLRPAVGPKPAEVAELIRALDGDGQAGREAARQKLEALGELAAPALREALAGKPSAEVRRQAQRLLKARKDDPPERLREARAVEAVERIATPAARRLLANLAGGAAGARLTAEARAALARWGRE